MSNRITSVVQEINNRTTVLEGTGVPVGTSSFIGQLYVDNSVTPKQVYIAVAVGVGEAMWRKITD